MPTKRTTSPLPGSKTKKRRKETKALPVKEIYDMLTQKFSNGTVQKEVAVFLEAVLQYLSMEILEMSANVAKNRSNGRAKSLKLTLDDVREAIDNDREMKELIERARKINSGG